jgi:hypothetical protein
MDNQELTPIKPIACFGDSHVSMFNSINSLITVEHLTRSDNFVLYQFGPWLAYRLPERINEFKKIYDTIDKSVAKYDLLLFGEIDCRSQVNKISLEQNRKPNEVISEIIGHYIDFINNVMDPTRLIIFSIPPCYIESPYEEYYEKNHDVHDKPRGTMKERNLYKVIFNRMMKDYCKANGIKFISIFNQIQNHPDKSSLYLDEIHLDPIKIKPIVNRALVRAGLST